MYSRQYSLERDDVWMVELAEVADVRLLDVAHLLNSNLLSVEGAKEDSPLCTTTQPLQIGDVLKWDLPFI